MALKRTFTGIILAAFAATALLLAVATSGVLNSSQTLHSQGALTPIQTTLNIGVYSDSACTQNYTSLNWGTLSAGGNATRTVWIKNAGTANATLSMTTSNWNPSNANQGVTLTWNRQGAAIVANAVVQATLTLNVSPAVEGIITTFAFNVQITGTSA